MRLPNGYGSVYKLSGKRRNPWVARKTIGWKDDPIQMKSFPVYHFVGYYHTRQEALQALSNFNRDPNESLKEMTLEDLYNRWSSTHFPKISESLKRGYKSCWEICYPIKDVKIKELKLDQIQTTIERSGKTASVIMKLKSMLRLMYEYAVIHELVPSNKKDMIRYIDIKGLPDPKKCEHIPFSEGEIRILWKNSGDDSVKIILVLIYSGLRVGELLDLKKEDVHPDDRWLRIRKAKTEAGVREVPIAEKTLPFIQYMMGKNQSEYLLDASGRSQMTYSFFRDNLWDSTMKRLKMTHRPHDTRHTCITLMTQVGVDSRVIKKIVGHTGDVTESVYTHVSLKTKLEAINKI